MNGYYKQVRAILLKNDWRYLRQSGSHETWCKDGHVPVTLSTNCKSRHTANIIMKEAGINHKF